MVTTTCGCARAFLLLLVLAMLGWCCHVWFSIVFFCIAFDHYRVSTEVEFEKVFDIAFFITFFIAFEIYILIEGYIMLDIAFEHRLRVSSSRTAFYIPHIRGQVLEPAFDSSSSIPHLSLPLQPFEYTTIVTYLGLLT